MPGTGAANGITPPFLSGERRCSPPLLSVTRCINPRLLPAMLSFTPLLSLNSKPPLFSSRSSFINPLNNNLTLRKIRNVTCRAEFSHDAPFAVAIGACILSSLVFPISGGTVDDDNDSVIDSTDARFAVMGIISFIPYFNWLSWVFAWLDTSDKRYAAYAIVYLAPYLRSNLSLSPEESWLPIASIIFGIFHVQLEASIRNGDLHGFQLFNEATKHLPLITKKKDHNVKGPSKEGRRKENKNLPSAQERSRNEVSGWGVPNRPSKDPEHPSEDGDSGERRKH